MAVRVMYLIDSTEISSSQAEKNFGHVLKLNLFDISIC